MGGIVARKWGGQLMKKRVHVYMAVTGLMSMTVTVVCFCAVRKHHATASTSGIKARITPVAQTS